MTDHNPDPDKLRDARRQAADVIDVLKRQGEDTGYLEVVFDLFTAALPAPKPRTMIETKWNDAEHFLAVAYDCESGREYIMLGQETDDEGEPNGCVLVSPVTPNGDPHPDLIHKESLVPTGRKYTLTPAEPVTESSEPVTASSDVSSEPLDPTDAQDLADMADEGEGSSQGIVDSSGSGQGTSPHAVQDVVHLFEERAESERAAGDDYVAGMWQQAAEKVKLLMPYRSYAWGGYGPTEMEQDPEGTRRFLESIQEPRSSQKNGGH